MLEPFTLLYGLTARDDSSILIERLSHYDRQGNTEPLYTCPKGRVAIVNISTARFTPNASENIGGVFLKWRSANAPGAGFDRIVHAFGTNAGFLGYSMDDGIGLGKVFSATHVGDVVLRPGEQLLWDSNAVSGGVWLREAWFWGILVPAGNIE